MPERRTTLPPLDYLVAFEAAARLGGFTAAGDHLNLSQAAISRKIRLLEDHLGEALFVRGHRSVELTASGEAYFETVRKALEDIRGATQRVKGEKRRPHVTIGATQSVSTLWLMPRLPRIRQDNPEFLIDLVSTDQDEECLRGEFDFIILRGEGRWAGYDAELLLDEEIFPVCTPSYAERTGLAEAADLRRCTLIEVSSHHEEWMNWRTWLHETGAGSTGAPHPLTFNTYALAVQAACDGLGISLGWRHLVDSHLAAEDLIRPVQESVRTGSGYYLLKPSGRQLSEASSSLRDWLFRSVGR